MTINKGDANFSIPSFLHYVPTYGMLLLLPFRANVPLSYGVWLAAMISPDK